MQEYRPAKEEKVRKTHDVREGLATVITDRVSAFDMILKDRITDKGTVLTQLSHFWLEYTKDVILNHMVSMDTADTPEFLRTPESERRSMLCKKPTMLPIECAVHGYTTGNGWESYKENGTVCGTQLPAGLQESEQLPEPIFTPSVKAEIGDHDGNVDFARCVEVLGKAFPGKGREYTEVIHDRALALYHLYVNYAETRGTIIADTKFGFGLNGAGEVVLVNGMLIPDSSRFWPLEGYTSGRSQPSSNRQLVRDWLKANPDSDYKLPWDAIGKTITKCKEAYVMLTGKELD